MEVSQKDNTSIIDGENVWDSMKKGCLAELGRLISRIEGMPDKELNKLFPHGKVIHTPKQCKATYVGNLKELKRRFGITTNEKNGGAEFQRDIEFLISCQDVIEKAGIAGSHDVTFDFNNRKCEPTMNGGRGKRPRNGA